MKKGGGFPEEVTAKIVPKAGSKYCRKQECHNDEPCQKDSKLLGT